MTNTPHLSASAAAVRDALATIDLTPFHEQEAALAERRRLIERTADQARARLAEITAEAAEAERVGADKFDVNRAPLAFRALMGEATLDDAEGFVTAADLLRERDELQLALRGEQAALDAVEIGKQALREDVRAVLAKACAPLVDYVRAELQNAAEMLGTLRSVAVVAAQLGQTRIDDGLTNAVAGFRTFLPPNIETPSEVLTAFAEAGPILKLANGSVHETVPVPTPRDVFAAPVLMRQAA